MVAPALDGKPTALFRFDAGPRTGGGHAVRCLTLAAALEGAGRQCRFAVNPEALETVGALAARSGDCIVLSAGPDGQTDEMGASLAGRGCELLVVDHYGWQAEQEAACRKFAQRILVMDDLADRPHDADILLDPGLGRLPDDYAGLVPDDCRLLLGPVHALLKPAFSELRAATLERRRTSREVRRLLVTFGLTDPENLTARALAAVAQAGGDCHVDVILGDGAPHLEQVFGAAARLGEKVRVVVGPDNMAVLMADADLAMGACGTTSWERCCLGLPTVAVMAAENQRLNAVALEAAGAIESLGWHDAVTAVEIAENLADLMASPDRLTALSVAATTLCDGWGAARVVGVVDDVIKGRDPALRPAVMADAEMLLAWRNDPETRRQSKTTAEVSLDTHRAWLQGVIDDDHRRLYVAEVAGAPVGSVRADRDGGAWVLSWMVAPEARGQGHGRRIVARLVEGLAGRIHAEVKPDNPASVRIAKALGMTPADDTGPLTLWVMNK